MSLLNQKRNIGSLGIRPLLAFPQVPGEKLLILTFCEGKEGQEGFSNPSVLIPLILLVTRPVVTFLTIVDRATIFAIKMSLLAFSMLISRAFGTTEIRMAEAQT